MPVSGSRTCDPKIKLIVEVIETAIPFLSTTDVWLCILMSTYTAVWTLITYCPVIDFDVVLWSVVFWRMGTILDKSLSSASLCARSYAHICYILKNTVRKEFGREDRNTVSVVAKVWIAYLRPATMSDVVYF